MSSLPTVGYVEARQLEPATTANDIGIGRRSGNAG